MAKSGHTRYDVRSEPGLATPSEILSDLCQVWPHTMLIDARSGPSPARLDVAGPLIEGPTKSLLQLLEAHYIKL